MSFEGISGKEEHQKEYGTGGEELAEKRYALDSGVNVDVAARAFLPEKGLEERGDRLVVFLPGWMMTAGDRSIEELCQAYADESGDRTLAISTRAEERGLRQDVDFLYEEARAIAKMIEESGAENVLLVGHSQGGNKGIDAASILQKDPGLHIDGLILLDSAGLYNQTDAEGIEAWQRSASEPDPKDALARERKREAMADIHRNNVSEMMRSNFFYPSRIGSEAAEGNIKNPHSAELEIPVTIVSGKFDWLSNPDKIVPPGAVKRLRSKLGEKPGEIDKTRAAREDYLQKNTFKKSPSVSFYTEGEFGDHMNPFERPNDLARTSLYLIKRAHRPLN